MNTGAPPENTKDIPTQVLLLVTGRVDSPCEFTLPQLLAMDRLDLDDLPLICGSGEPLGRTGRLSGVLLADILARVPVITSEHNDTKRMYVVAAAADGYKTVFSWQEIFNSDNGAGIVVLLEREGHALHPDYRAIDLISARDHLSGPRYVKRLHLLEIFMVP